MLSLIHILCVLNKHSKILEATSVRPWQKNASAELAKKCVEWHSSLFETVLCCVTTYTNYFIRRWTLVILITYFFLRIFFFFHLHFLQTYEMKKTMAFCSHEVGHWLTLFLAALVPENEKLLFITHQICISLYKSNFRWIVCSDD